MSTRSRRSTNPSRGLGSTPDGAVYKVAAERTFIDLLIAERGACVLSASQRPEENSKRVPEPDTVLQCLNVIHPRSGLVAFHGTVFGLVGPGDGAGEKGQKGDKKKQGWRAQVLKFVGGGVRVLLFRLHPFAKTILLFSGA